MSGKFDKFKIKEVVEDINDKYFLPALQREFVWLSDKKAEKIERLFDSLMRGYPISSFLFWKVDKSDIANPKDSLESQVGKLNFQLYKFITDYDAEHPHNEKIPVDQIKKEELFVVLDGQQRLTSLYIGLKGSRRLKRERVWKTNPYAYEEEKNLYLNLKKVKEDSETDCKYEFKFLTLKEAEVEKDESHNWFRVGLILQKDFNVRKFSNLQGYTFEEEEILGTLYDAICQYDNISCFIESNKKLEEVLNIFIRTNSGGTQLSYSDLLMSILISSFKTDIRERINEEVDYAKNIGFKSFGRDHLLKTALFLTGEDHKFKLDNFNSERLSKIEKEQDKIFNAVRNVLQLLTDMGYKDKLSSGYIVTVLAYWIYKNDLNSNKIKDDELATMVEFVRITQILSYFSTGLDSKLTDVKDSIKDAKSFREFMDNMSKLDGRKALKVTLETIEDILSFKYGRDNVFPVLQLLYPSLDYSRNKFDMDHIYPQAKIRRGHEEWSKKKDYIWNLQLLETDDNKSKSKKDPEVWLKEVFNSEEERKKYLESNLIDKDFELSWENFETFEEMRKRNMREKLMKVFKIEGDYGS